MRNLAWVAGAIALAAVCGASCGDDTTGAGGSTAGPTSAVGTGSPSATTSGSTHAASGSTVTGSTATGGTADTWDNYAKDFFATYCVECHGAGDPTRDYTLLAPVMAEAAEIRCGVGDVIESGCTGFPPPKQFPVDNATHDNPKPTDPERQRLIAWIDAGTPN